MASSPFAGYFPQLKRAPVAASISGPPPLRRRPPTRAILSADRRMLLTLQAAVRARRMSPAQANAYWRRAHPRKLAAHPARVRTLALDEQPPSLGQLQSLAGSVAQKAGLAAAGLGALGIGTGTVSSAAAALAPVALPLAAVGIIAASVFGGKSQAQLLAEANAAGRAALDAAGAAGVLTSTGDVPTFVRGQRGAVNV